MHKLIDVSGRALKPWVVGKNLTTPMSQLISAEGIFIRNYSQINKYSNNELLKTSLLLHDIYHSYDVVYYLLKEFDIRSKTDLSNTYYNYIIAQKNIKLQFVNIKDHIDSIT